MQRIRAEVFDEEPFCRMCVLAGRVTDATIVDHIVPLAEGGQDVPENRQPLCRDCHDAKTAEESKRGVQAYHRARR